MSAQSIFSLAVLIHAFAALLIATPSSAGADTVEVKIENSKFTPAKVTIKPGDTVHWTWSASGHSTTSGSGCNKNNLWNSAIQGAGSEFIHTFDTVGEYPYFCQPHCQFGMTGSVTVAQSIPDGSGNALDNPIPNTIGIGHISVRLIPVASGLTAPNLGVSAPGDKNRLFVSDQIGIIWGIDVETGNKTKFGDLSAWLTPLGVGGPGTYDERGLLGLAFHPRYRSNGLLYTYTSEPTQGNPDFSTQPSGVSANHQSVIREWHVSEPKKTSSVVDPNNSRVLLRIDQPQFNHNGGSLVFGKDGMLYIALGDGGNADDEGNGHSAQGNGQDKSNVLGKILRINPNSRTANNGQYGIPKGNPFRPKSNKTQGGQSGCADGACDEIFAIGLRNPFRMSFDITKGKLYTGDTGQNSIEEVDVIRPGANYGWPIQEGSFCFDGKGLDDGVVTDAAACGPNTLIAPVAQYDHDEGKAIIGGFVYRGKQLPQLRGHYVFGDYAKSFSNDGRLFYLANANLAGSKRDKKSEPLELHLTNPSSLGLSLLGFGQDAARELYVLGNLTGIPAGDTGVVLRIAP